MNAGLDHILVRDLTKTGNSEGTFPGQDIEM